MSTLQTPAAPAVPAVPPAPGRAHTGSFLALVGGAFAIGFAPIFVRASEVGPVSTAVWRVVLAVPVLWLIAAFAPADRPASVPGDVPPTPPVPAGRWGGWEMMLVAGLFFAGDLAVWHWSIRFTSVANSTLLANLAPIFVVLYPWVVYGQRAGRRFLLAMTVSMAGMALLIGRDFRLEGRALLGDALGVVTAVFYAGYLLSIKSLRGRFPTTTVMSRTALLTALALLPIAAVSGEAFWPRTAHGWAMVVGLALVSHVGGQTLITFSLAKLPAAVASVTLLIQPVAAALFAALLLHEPVVWMQAVGMALVLAGVFVARQEGTR